jgi:predicted nucleotidyltransferase
VKLKKYFYVLRPLFAIRFIENHDRPPPVEFDQLVSATAPREIIPCIEYLLKLKKSTTEMGYGNPVPEINDFIKSELGRYGELFKGQGRPDLIDQKDKIEKLNELFRSCLHDTY